MTLYCSWLEQYRSLYATAVTLFISLKQGERDTCGEEEEEGGGHTHTHTTIVQLLQVESSRRGLFLLMSYNMRGAI